MTTILLIVDRKNYGNVFLSYAGSPRNGVAVELKNARGESGGTAPVPEEGHAVSINSIVSGSALD